VYNKSYVPLFKEQFVVCKSYKEFVEHITTQYETNGIYPNFISFAFMSSNADYILNGEDYSVYRSDEIYNEGSGVDCAEWIIKFCKEKGLKLPDYFIHDTNMTGRRIISKLFKLANENNGANVMDKANDESAETFDKANDESAEIPEIINDDCIEITNESESDISVSDTVKKRGRKKGWRKNTTIPVETAEVVENTLKTDNILVVSDTVKKRGRKKGWRKNTTIPVEIAEVNLNKNNILVVSDIETVEVVVPVENTLKTDNILVVSDTVKKRGRKKGWRKNTNIPVENITETPDTVLKDFHIAFASLTRYIKILENENFRLKNELKKLETF
jgi:hypothetical protein